VLGFEVEDLAGVFCLAGCYEGGRNDLRGEVGGGNLAPFFEDQHAEGVHVHFSIVARAGKGLKTNLFVVVNIFSPSSRGLIFLDIFLSFDSDL
jgi:hypothetical protein